MVFSLFKKQVLNMAFSNHMANNITSDTVLVMWKEVAKYGKEINDSDIKFSTL